MRPTAFALFALLLAGAAPALAEPPVVPYAVPAEPGITQEVWARGFNLPWSIVWLPDGRALVTEKPGTMKILDKDGRVVADVAGVPQVLNYGQGGLLDVALHPDFATNGLIYFTFAVGEEGANHTALARGRLVGNQLQDVQELLRNPLAKEGRDHFGSRLLWLPDRTLLMSVGDGGDVEVKYKGEYIRYNAQRPNLLFGRILRLTENGEPVADNPGNGARKGEWDPRIHSIGHRNPQGLALDSKTGTIWATEHAPKGGDELNRIEAGRNYGWPIVTYGEEYAGGPIAVHTSFPGYQDPVSVWVPSIAPSGLAVYRGSAFPALDGALLAGGLRSRDVRVLRIGADGRPASEHRIEVGGSVRDVRVGPDGLIYLLLREGDARILRLRPTP